MTDEELAKILRELFERLDRLDNTIVLWFILGAVCSIALDACSIAASLRSVNNELQKSSSVESK